VFVNKTEEEIPPEPSPLVLSAFNKIGLIGEITEAVSNQVIFALLSLKDTLEVFPEEEEEDALKEEREIELVVSTQGGNADDMFAIYDMIRLIREECDIKTTGVGKVMSAGVLLLASGTKGKRRVGKNCRIMIHSVIGGHVGPMHQLENEMTEFKKIQELYLNSLVEETNMTKAYLNKLMKKKVNIYLTAEEAIELGIADEIF
jgi:ATP-dependent Clp protease protease subunit